MRTRAPSEFLKQFFAGTLPISRDHISVVRQSLRQQPGTVRNATGLHTLSDPWKNAELFAKTGATTDAAGTSVSWLVGAVRRGQETDVFVSAAWRSGTIDPLHAARNAIAALKSKKLL